MWVGRRTRGRVDTHVCVWFVKFSTKPLGDLEIPSENRDTVTQMETVVITNEKTW